MTWGFVDVIAQYYYYSKLNRKGYYYKYARKYEYDNSEVKGTLEAIWQRGYKSIANCNNLLQNIKTEDVSSFAGGEIEKNMIEGEALALRAFMHFDMLRLFAPAPINDDGNLYIPYCNIYPSILKAPETVNSCLEKTINDLLKAKELVASFDTIPEHILWLKTDYRIEAANNQGYKMPDDLFYAYRGFRMNYYAITAILARVYSYAGDLENAYKQAEEVCDAEDSDGFKLFDFCRDFSTAKLYDGVVFALSNKKLIENFETYHTGDNKTLSIDMTGIFDGEEGDVRCTFIREEGSGRSKTYISEKYLESDDHSFIGNINAELIPIIRRSELCYIMGEYLYSIGKTKDAIDKLKEVRIARKVPNDLPESVNNMDDYKRELLRDAKRDFIGEGQMFYMYKKYNVMPYKYMETGDFVLPIPDSEDINL